MTSAFVEAIFVEGFVGGWLFADFIFDPPVNFDPSSLVMLFREPHQLPSPLNGQNLAQNSDLRTLVQKQRLILQGGKANAIL